MIFHGPTTGICHWITLIIGILFTNPLLRVSNTDLGFQVDTVLIWYQERTWEATTAGVIKTTSPIESDLVYIAIRLAPYTK